MQTKEVFNFIGFQLYNRKNAEKLKEEEKKYLVLTVVNKDNSLIKLFVFKPEIIEKVLEKNLNRFDDVTLTLLFSYNMDKNTWNCRLEGIE